MERPGRRALALAAGAVSVGAAVTGVAYATTGPAPHTLVNVQISDTSIKLSKNKVSDVTFVDFYLHNVGKLRHNMRIGRQTSVAVRPGQRVHFYVGFPVYGWYPYKVTLRREAADEGPLPYRIAATAGLKNSFHSALLSHWRQRP